MLARFLIFSLLAGGFNWALSKKWGAIPPLMPLFCPFQGFWQQAEQQSLASTIQVLKHENLGAPVTLAYDSMLVPHIYAENEADAYWAQGYVTAADRLWQMEFQTRAAAGRISEIVGSMALEFDKHQRKIGMPYAAEICAKAMLENDTTRIMLEQYCKGVNAWIESLSEKTLPVEYKILHYKPEPWTPLQCALLLKYMAYDLTANRSSDLDNTRFVQKFGLKQWEQWFAEDFTEPVIPEGTNWAVDNQKPPLDSAIFQSIDNGTRLSLSMLGTENENNDDEIYIGSNNWAVHGSKTATGYPILANDPHLSLNLPSLWYLVHLSAPGLEVMGATLPGAPGIIIGFNEDVAWGVTNGYYDVLDWYTIDWANDDKTKYRLNGELKDVAFRTEYIHVAGEEPIVEKVRYTHFGPVPYLKGEKPFKSFIPVNCAMKWQAHEPSNELRTFALLNKATDIQNYKQAILTYRCPAQNFAFATRRGDIAITTQGRVPQKQPYQGKFILDGSTDRFNWGNTIPAGHLPFVANPARGFVSSANQIAADSTFPYFIYGEYSTPERAQRMNELLARLNKATPETMLQIQNDVLDVHARLVLPTLLQAIEQARLKENEKQVFDQLASWKYQNLPEEVGPTVMKSFWRLLNKSAFADETGDSLPYPDKHVVNKLVFQPNHACWDNVNTKQRETMPTIATEAFKKAVEELETSLGSYKDNAKAWAWGAAKGTYLQHVARMDGFGTKPLLMGGGPTIVNATSQRHGPSLKIVVATGQVPEAFAIFPGGQSGNPGSRHYADFVETWRLGKLKKLDFYFSRPTRNPL